MSVRRSALETQGFAATYSRGLEIVMQTQIEAQLRDWSGPPLVLVQPKVEHISMFAFDKTDELIDAGYRATSNTLDQLGTQLGGVARYAPNPPAQSTGRRGSLCRLRFMRGSGPQGLPAGWPWESRSTDADPDLVSH
jgi:hypothetical protein